MTPVLLYIYRKPPLRDQRGRKRKSVTVRVGSSRAVSGNRFVWKSFDGNLYGTVQYKKKGNPQRTVTKPVPGRYRNGALASWPIGSLDVPHSCCCDGIVLMGAWIWREGCCVNQPTNQPTTAEGAEVGVVDWSCGWMEGSERAKSAEALRPCVKRGWWSLRRARRSPKPSQTYGVMGGGLVLRQRRLERVRFGAARKLGHRLLARRHEVRARQFFRRLVGQQRIDFRVHSQTRNGAHEFLLDGSPLDGSGPKVVTHVEYSP